MQNAPSPARALAMPNNRVADDAHPGRRKSAAADDAPPKPPDVSGEEQRRHRNYGRGASCNQPEAGLELCGVLDNPCLQCWQLRFDNPENEHATGRPEGDEGHDPASRTRIGARDLIPAREIRGHNMGCRC